MNYLSVCSGIEAATVAWHPLGWKPFAFSEIERFPSEVLAHHYPNTPNLGDMTKFKEWPDANINVFVGGTPCQSFSVAGLRKGLDDPRGNLMLTYLAIAAKYRPKWVVWENVPGVLSSNRGLDFATFLRGLGECGYGFAYRILDAQYFGVPQRRRRVFVVGCLGDWRSAAAVLFERHSLQGHPAPSRKKRKSVTNSIGDSTQGSYDCGVELTGPLSARDYKDPGTDGMNKNSAKMIPVTKAFYESSLAQYKEADLAGTAKASGGVAGGGSETFIAQPIALAENTIGRQPQNGGNGDGFTDGGPMYTLNATGVHGVVQPVGTDLYNFAITGDISMTLKRGDGNPAINQPTVMQPVGFTRCDHGGDAVIDGTPTMRCGSNYSAHLAAAIPSMQVRRLTPVECERLQGFPDNYTDIQPKGKPTPDGPRYKALGNSMAVPVMAWIGKRIQMVEDL